MIRTICIMCPMGCYLDIDEDEGQVFVRGNQCPRGEEYGKQEYIAPVRVLTTIIKRTDGGLASVKTTGAIPKDKIRQAAKYIGKLTVDADCKLGDVVEENFFADGVNLVISGRA